MSMFPLADRLANLEGNVFAGMDRVKAVARQSGQDIIDLSLGSADIAVADEILAEIQLALWDPQSHGYQLFQSTRPFREAAAQWYQRRFGLEMDPETEVLALIGSQEGTAHFPLALLNPGDYALVLDPGYPSHAGGVHLAGGRIYPMPLRPENDFLPMLSDVPATILAQAKLLILSYPHNPTTAIAPLSFFQEAVQFCQRHGLVLVHDFPYVDLVFDAPPAPSIFQADRDRSCSIEFFSLSKSYNMGGFRLGFAIGRAQLIQALAQIKSVIDFNQYAGILRGGIIALNSPHHQIQATIDTFRDRRDRFIEVLQDQGWPVTTPPATMYIWAPLPDPWHHNSLGFCQELLLHTGVAASPGSGFGPTGEGFVRFALVRDRQTLTLAAERIMDFLKN
ncbi:LL-diaminopimelate aminotransferase [Candidatus Synechococcus calcipolaris G9]|uniref:Aminotransferase n=1 Tax=Candidatus Synechococcus calcipolaris G9 TaxID=1497997 RepID=A0ABT6F2K3_9SYNE|nr:LL-diaminopimelate aminotransferase [Candidatus Synechococcus calcipolaris]MDG2992047.1 LL-diaminopimelate aminotransferase [Candidatus Synechococcus calcipolaris G9]